MPEVTLNDNFGSSISQIIKNFNCYKVLEIGSWDGTGSTKCIINGMLQFDQKSLTCLEVDETKFADLTFNVSHLPWVKCHNESSICYESLVYKNFDEIWNSPFNGLPRQWNPKEIVQGWFDRDVEAMKKIKIGFLEKDTNRYDAALIDGGEFTGYSEFSLLKDKVNFFFLDDAFHAFKTRQVFFELYQDSSWECLCYDENTRNGFAIFKRRNLLCTI
jgi:hypothetical protein